MKIDSALFLLGVNNCRLSNVLQLRGGKYSLPDHHELPDALSDFNRTIETQKVLVEFMRSVAALVYIQDDVFHITPDLMLTMFVGASRPEVIREVFFEEGGDTFFVAYVLWVKNYPAFDASSIHAPLQSRVFVAGIQS